MSKSKRFYFRKSFYIKLIIFLVGCAVFFYLLNGYIMPSYTRHDEGVTVPNITRLPLDRAKQMLKSSGLEYEVLNKRSNEAFPAGYVIEQNPEPFSIVKPGRKIYLSVNVISHSTVKMPNLENLSLRNARIQLENSGLKIGTISYQSGRFKNTVLHQSIPPGTSVKRGTEVDMLVSNGLGKEKVVIPDIIGVSLTKAKKMVRKIGLRVGKVHYKLTQKEPSGTVINYFPEVKKTTVGSTLQLVVSKQPGVISPDTLFQIKPPLIPDTSNIQ